MSRRFPSSIIFLWFRKKNLFSCWTFKKIGPFALIASPCYVFADLFILLVLSVEKEKKYIISPFIDNIFSFIIEKYRVFFAHFFPRSSSWSALWTESIASLLVLLLHSRHVFILIYETAASLSYSLEAVFYVFLIIFYLKRIHSIEFWMVSK